MRERVVTTKKDTSMSFENLGLQEAITRAVRDAGYTQATDVQQHAIGPALNGADLMVSARTGSGKTAAFILPALQRGLAGRAAMAGQRRDRSQPPGPRVLVLVLTPTRELALQVARAAISYGRHVPYLRVATIVGGVPYAAQLKALRDGPDLLIATPGRLIDHMQSGRCRLDRLELLVLDEADRMLDMGFIDDIRAIAESLPASRQTLLFSATLDGVVGRLALSLTHEPQRIEITTTPVQEAKIEERLMLIDGFEHKHRLLEKILGDGELQQAVVFTATKRSAEDLTERMIGWGVRAAALHGDMTQRARTRTLDRLRRGEVQVLVATDVAARGIDVAGISHVINFDPPRQAEDYVHRIGRTGRAGRSGVAITLTHPNEMRTIGAIERFTGRRLAEHVIEGLEPRAPRRPAGAGRGGFEGSRGGKPSGPRTPAPRRSEDSPRRWGDSPRSHEGRQERAAAPRAYGETAPRSEFERRVRGDDGDRRTLGVSGERKPRSSWGNKDHHPQRDGEGWGRRRRDR